MRVQDAVFAQSTTNPTPEQATSEQCSYFKKIETAKTESLREDLLTPGKTLNAAAIMSDPQLAETMRQMAQQDQARAAQDWAALCTYKAQNMAQQSKGAPRAIFLGDSITEFWQNADAAYFSDKTIDRGISGQTSSQILLRFLPDVVSLRPAVIHLLVGTNDVAENTGPISDEDFLNNIRAMIDLARANHIKLVLGSIPPAKNFNWRPQVLHSAERIVRLNNKLRTLSTEQNIVFVNYYPALVDDQGGMRSDLSNDGVHPNRDGYARMRPLAEAAIAKALRNQSR